MNGEDPYLDVWEARLIGVDGKTYARWKLPREFPYKLEYKTRMAMVGSHIEFLDGWERVVYTWDCDVSGQQRRQVYLGPGDTFVATVNGITCSSC